MCGWQDFRHSLTKQMRRNGTHPKVISNLLGHKKVNLAMDVYDRSNLKDFEQALGSVGNQLLPVVTQHRPRNETLPNVLMVWWAHQDLNLEPTDYESAALTVEL